MKLKTFLVSYFSFLLILFLAISIISLYLLNSQMDTLRQQSIREYQRFSNVLILEINILYERTENLMAIDSLLQRHIAFYEAQGISLQILRLPEGTQIITPQNITFTRYAESATFNLRNQISTEIGIFDVSMIFDVTEEISDLTSLQRNLLLIFLGFAIITFIFLYAVMTKLFKPLQLVMLATDKIAKGDYSQRIKTSDKSDIGKMAEYFNQMATVIEDHVNNLELESNKKQQFIDNFAHEVRTPLTAIYGYAEYINKAKLTEDVKFKTSSYIMSEAKYLTRLANTMLELATMRDLDFEMDVIKLSDLFAEVKKTAQMKVVKHSVMLHLTTVDADVFGNFELLKSLLVNLIVNAVHACAENVGRVDVEASLVDGMIEVCVKDNGCGIAIEDLLKIEDPFYRVDSSRNRRNGGTGLGLSLCKQIASLHNTSLTFASKVDTGTSVMFLLTTS